MMYNNIIVPQNSKGLCCIPFEFKARLAFTVSCVLCRINLDRIIFFKKYFIKSQPKTHIPTDSSDKNAWIPHLLGTWTAANNEPTVPTKAPHILGWGSGGGGCRGLLWLVHYPASFSDQLSTIYLEVLTLQVPIVTNINFLLTISICCQEKWLWEIIKWSLNRKCFDLFTNSLN